jgi:hypothetical protein
MMYYLTLLACVRKTQQARRSPIAGAQTTGAFGTAFSPYMEATPQTTAVAAPAVRGVNASRRPWKKPMKMRSSAMTRPQSANSSGSGIAFRVQRARRLALELAKSAEKERAESIAHQKQELKRKREEKEKRKAENALKGTVYQVVGVVARGPFGYTVCSLSLTCHVYVLQIKNPEKLKKMSKKQLRHVKRTRVNEHGVVEFVGAYEK